MYENDEIIIKGSKEKIIPAKIPRYFDKQREKEYDLTELKEQRKQKAINNQNVKMQSTELCKAAQLKVEMRTKEKKIKALRRDRAYKGQSLTS